MGISGRMALAEVCFCGVVVWLGECILGRSCENEVVVVGSGGAEVHLGGAEVDLGAVEVDLGGAEVDLGGAKVVSHAIRVDSLC